VAKIYLGLGSNLGSREENLQQAVAKLAPEITVTKVSPVYESEPMYLETQPKFLNAACEAQTLLSPLETLRKIKSIEKEMGEHDHNGPRVIDIDLLLYGDEKIDTPELVVPHADMAERAFVVMPLSDIAPDLVHPLLGRSISELKAGLGDVSKGLWPAGFALSSA
jgi:2-amino-4-hydroxy-6-hydroxymethyldihydropteridine diphosphokinase